MASATNVKSTDLGILLSLKERGLALSLILFIQHLRPNLHTETKPINVLLMLIVNLGLIERTENVLYNYQRFNIFLIKSL